MKIEEFITFLNDVKQSGNQYSSCCPAHDDKSPSLSLSTGDKGQLLVTCHGGCTLAQILEAMVLEEMDLYPENRPPTTLAEIAEVKKLPVEWLAKFGVSDAKYGIEIPYWLSNNESPIIKTRRSLDAGSSRWPAGVAVRPYGCWSMANFAQGKKLTLVEGESDVWTGWSYGLPVLGFPGAKTVRKALTPDLLVGIEVIDVIEEPDKGGAEFVAGVATALRQADWNGSARVIRLINAKDLSDLHIQDPSKFMERFNEAAKFARPLDLTASVQPAVAVSEVTHVPADTASWPNPKPISALDSAPADFPAEQMLPQSLVPWIRDEAERMGVAVAQVAVGAVVALSTVIGKKVVILPGAHDLWRVVPNVWGAIVAPPGSMKTPALNAGLAPVLALDDETRKHFEQHRAKYELDQMVLKHRRQKLEADIKKSIDNGVEPQHLVVEMQKVLDQPLGLKRYVTNDTTVEALAGIVQGNSNGVLIVRDELLGLLLQFEKPGHENDRQFYLEGWTGLNSFTTDRIGRGTTHIPGLRLTVVGTIQKEPFRQLVRRNQNGSDGLLQRFQLLIDAEMQPPTLRVDRQPDLVARERAFQTYRKLDTLTGTQLGVQDDLAGAPYLRFSADAQPLFDAFFVDLDKKVEAEGNPLIRSHLIKYRSLVPSLALLFHLADVAAGLVQQGPVSKSATEMALKWSTFLEAHARELMSSMPDRVAAIELAHRLLDGSVPSLFTERELYRKEWKGLERSRFRRLLHLLESIGWLRRCTTQTGGRPSVVWHLNPQVSPDSIDV